MLIIFYQIVIAVENNLLLSTRIVTRLDVEYYRRYRHYSRFFSASKGGNLMKANQNVREAAKLAGVHHWEIALEIGVSEQTLVRWLRTPLDADSERKVLLAIETLERRKNEV